MVHQIVRFAKMIFLTGAALRMISLHFFGRRTTLDLWSGKIRKKHWYEAASSALNFPFWKEVSQNCFVFDVVKFKN